MNSDNKFGYPEQNLDINKIIEDTVNAAVIKFKVHGLIENSRKTALQKTEELLKNYTVFKKVNNQPYTTEIVKMIDEALKEVEEDFYYEIIPMYFFENKTREIIAEHFNTTTTTISRNKKRLLNKIKIRLFSDDVISELLL